MIEQKKIKNKYFCLEIRREINAARAKIFEETRSLESSNTEVTRQLDSLREIVNYVVPYISSFEQIRWLVGLGNKLMKKIKIRLLINQAIN